MQTTDLPALNATLNGTAATLLLLARIAIHRHNEVLHRRLMLGATCVTCLFLVSYVTYHSLHGSTKFGGTGASRGLYFSILGSHTLLAASLAPLVFLTLRRALRGDREGHHRIARFTWPIWMYVSVTGVIIYFMLYQWFRPIG